MHITLHDVTYYSDTVLMQSSIRNIFSGPRVATCVQTDGQDIRATLADAALLCKHAKPRLILQEFLLPKYEQHALTFIRNIFNFVNILLIK